MALQLAYKVNDVGGEYWRIMGINVNMIQNVGKINLGLFKDKNARQSGCSPITQKTYVWEGKENPFDPKACDDPIKTAYEKMKKLPEWKDSVDA